MEGSRRHHLGGRSEAREHGATGARQEEAGGLGRGARRSGGGGAISGAIWRYLAISFYLILSRVDLTKEPSRLAGLALCLRGLRLSFVSIMRHDLVIFTL